MTVLMKMQRCSKFQSQSKILEKKVLFIIFSIVLISISPQVFAQDDLDSLLADKDAPFGDILLHHVTNDQNQAYIPIEIGGLDLSITKHVILIWVVSAIVIALGVLGTSRYRNNKNKKYSCNDETIIYYLCRSIDTFLLIFENE